MNKNFNILILNVTKVETHWLVARNSELIIKRGI